MRRCNEATCMLEGALGSEERVSWFGVWAWFMVAANLSIIWVQPLGGFRLLVSSVEFETVVL